ncbi:MAG: ADP-ribosylglycohydrolase family protein [Paracoccus sp. (in: a-proteobacteria)]|nr:ADP-ribosylglycohydrolase family protein [Paracoccus sp. (in: a-proteobacteria)]
MFGLAVRDALGAPVERLTRGRFVPVTCYRAGGYFRLPAGAWTDDTAMALCLADSICAAHPFDEADLLARFCRWVELAENTSTGLCIGAGKNTLRALGHHRRTGALTVPRYGAHSDGNGVLMRLAPVAIRYRADRELAQHVALQQGRTTHASPLSEAACAFVLDLLLGVIAGKGWNDALAAAEAGIRHDQIFERIAARQEDELPPSSGYVLDTLQAAIWSVHRAPDFPSAVLTAVNLGGDTDTVGAVTGQIAGARWGLSAIPQDWIGGLVRRDLIESASNKLIQSHK